MRERKREREERRESSQRKAEGGSNIIAQVVGGDNQITKSFFYPMQ